MSLDCVSTPSSRVISSVLQGQSRIQHSDAPFVHDPGQTKIDSDRPDPIEGALGLQGTGREVQEVAVMVSRPIREVPKKEA